MSASSVGSPDLTLEGLEAAWAGRSGTGGRGAMVVVTAAVDAVGADEAVDAVGADEGVGADDVVRLIDVVVDEGAVVDVLDVVVDERAGVGEEAVDAAVAVDRPAGVAGVADEGGAAVAVQTG